MRSYKLSFYSGLHVDGRGSGEPMTAEEYIRSDPFSAALTIAWAQLYPEDGETLFENPPFKISSAFPHVGETLLFPAPAWRIWRTGAEVDKELKRVRWLSQSLFRSVLGGQEIDPSRVEILSGGVAVEKEELKSKPELKRSPFWAMEERQRVAVDRLGLATDGGLFFFALEFFNSDSGLWIAADVHDNNAQRLRSVLDFLGDTGIGADRNSGLGHYYIKEETELSFPVQKDKSGWLTLSLFNPGAMDDLEKLTSITAYGLITRSGWVSGKSLGRAPVRAFTEGSFFSQKPFGRVLAVISNEHISKYKLSISHPVFRDFRAIGLSCAIPPYLKEGEL
jgi:CRISPR-associated protein Csm4